MATAALMAVQGISPTSSISPRTFLISKCSHITSLNLQRRFSSGGARYYGLKRESNGGPVTLFQKKRPYSSIYRIRAADESMKPPYNVLITGSSKGIGYALAKEFLRAGDNVIICSRSDDNVKIAVKNLESKFGDQHLWGTTCDVRDGESVRALVDFARNNISYVDIWAMTEIKLIEMERNLIVRVLAEIREELKVNGVLVRVCRLKVGSCQSLMMQTFFIDRQGASRAKDRSRERLKNTKKSSVQNVGKLKVNGKQLSLPV